jgi:hypothetical protein
MILQHQKTQDGNAAWLDLVDDMETQGNIGQLVAENTNELAQVKLRYDSRGGFSTYKQDFCALTQRLEDAGEGMSDLMKKTFFLMNIQDESYTSIKTTCRSDPTLAFKETVQKIKAEAKAMGKLEDSRNSVRTARATKQRPSGQSDGRRPPLCQRAIRNAVQARRRGDQGRSNGRKFPMLPSHIWKQMNERESTDYKDAWENTKNQRSPNLNHQYPRLNRQAKNAVKIEP